MGPIELLNELADDCSPGGVGEQGELPQVLDRGVTVS
jgi:hypothetical protein